MNLGIELVLCPGCRYLTHYQWITHGTGGVYCPECKGKRIGLPASALELVGLIHRIAPPSMFVQLELFDVVRV